MHRSLFRPLLTILLAGLCVCAAAPDARAQAAAPSDEGAYYVIETIPIPDDVVLEVGGLALLPSGDLGVSTRRGEVWIVENPDAWGRKRPFFRRFAHGLHEPLGLAFHGGALYTAQRNELTRLEDTDGDGRADVYETVYDWPVSGNYHEYAFGPVFRENGDMLVTLNLGSFGQMESVVPWRGWMLEVTPDGAMTPVATGMRSPAGFTVTRDGAVFYAENQGDWIGSGWVTHVAPGDFVGNPTGLRWTDEPGVPERLRGLKPGDVPDTGEPMHVVAGRVPALKPPAVWFPHGIMGVSTSGILEDTTGGLFGPFAGQLFVGDQGHSKIMRMALEQVGGVYQGVVFPFREGFQSGVLRMIWSRTGEMYVGMTSRGWDATGQNPYGLQRLRWTGAVPFEAQTVHARPDGFEVAFTLPADAGRAADPASYRVTSFTYKYHHVYGSPVVEQQPHAVRAVRVSDDGRTARLVVDGLRQGYIYEIKMPGVRAADGRALLHDTGYYTLNRIPEGERLAVAPDAPHAHTPPSNDPPAGDPPVETQPARPAAPAARQPKRVNTMPADWTRPDVSVTVGTVPGLRYDLPTFQARPGARVELVFSNTDDMLHNLVVVVPGAADRVAQEAVGLGLEGMEKHFVPETADVLFHTALLQPGASERLYFTAPTEPGEYTYVCTFPGHAFTMRGTMVVTP